MGSSEIKDLSVKEFAAELELQSSYSDGHVMLREEKMTDHSMERLAGGLLVFAAELKSLDLRFNAFGSEGLGALAEALRLFHARKTLEELDISYNLQVTTLQPLVAAGVLDGLTQLDASYCLLSGVFPLELGFNLPALQVFDLSGNLGGFTLTAEALCALPQGCKVVLFRSKVQLARPSADGEMGLVALPTAYGEEFGAEYASDAKTVAEICAFAGVQHMALVKPARASESIDELLERVTTENQNVYKMPLFKPEFTGPVDFKREAVLKGLLCTARGFLKQGRSAEGLDLLRDLADRGLPEAQCIYGLRMLGFGETCAEKQKGRELIQKARAKDDPLAVVWGEGKYGEDVKVSFLARGFYQQFAEGKMRAAKQSFRSSGTAAAQRALDYLCHNCSVCDKSSFTSTMFVCGACKGPRYCGVGCQKADWAKHKFVCEKKGGL